MKERKLSQPTDADDVIAGSIFSSPAVWREAGGREGERREGGGAGREGGSGEEGGGGRKGVEGVGRERREEGSGKSVGGVISFMRTTGRQGSSGSRTGLVFEHCGGTTQTHTRTHAHTEFISTTSATLIVLRLTNRFIVLHIMASACLCRGSRI